ncbi:hypothetical protein [Streptomyces sp. A30]|uniref:hypothetical protein n=1 Tax=Streptomyces sp. A30 TaxID=2789273 RepID=UPI0039818F2D
MAGTSTRPSIPSPPPAPAHLSALPCGPSGPGTSATRLSAPATPGSSAWRPSAPQPRREAAPAADPAPKLHCPPAVRDDRALGDAVTEGLVEWAEEVGIYPGRLDMIRKADFGRLIMLAHPESDDLGQSDEGTRPRRRKPPTGGSLPPPPRWTHVPVAMGRPARRKRLPPVAADRVSGW